MKQNADAHSNSVRCAILLSCPDAKGIVAQISHKIAALDGNIVESAQHHAADSGNFYMRVEWDHPVGAEWLALDAGRSDSEVDKRQSVSSAASYAQHKQLEQTLTAEFADIATQFNMNYQIVSLAIPIPTVIMVSKQLHCLNDLLWNAEHGLLPRCDIRAVISNHRDAERICTWMEKPFHYTEMVRTADGAVDKQQLESAQLEIAEQYGAELIVMARYMQILSERFIDSYPLGIINIHHSFLPAFIGAKPYHQAYARGVKLIGATSHYATVDLDQGPIIEQDVVRVTHKDDIETMVRKGNLLERDVLTHAVRLHTERRIMAVGNKTVIFT